MYQGERRVGARNRSDDSGVVQRRSGIGAISEVIDLKKLIQQGAPASGDQARQIIRVAMENAEGSAKEWEKRLSSALTEILVGRQLHAETYAARAQALAVLNEIESHAPAAPKQGGR